MRLDFFLQIWKIQKNPGFYKIQMQTFLIRDSGKETAVYQVSGNLGRGILGRKENRAGVQIGPRYGGPWNIGPLIKVLKNIICNSILMHNFN